MADPATKLMYLFPGQGSQYAGMGSDLCEAWPLARSIYDRAGEVLGYDIAEISFENPGDKLHLTRHTQPALLTHQYACLSIYRDLVPEAIQPALVAGHSLGEYTALVAAGALEFEDGLRLVRKRGELMGEFGEGGMLALAVDVETARPVATRHCCEIASINLPQQTVVGGRESDLDALAEEAKELWPRKRSVRLNTEGAFHTYFMVTAAMEFRRALEAQPFAAPRIPVLSNFTGQAHDGDAGSIRSRLFFQLFNPVDWVGCLGTAIDTGIGRFVEFGGGIGKGELPAEKRPNLEGIVKKTLRARDYEAEYTGLINRESLEAAAS